MYTESALLGGEPSDRVQFELDFRRVEVVVICGDGVEPIRSSIARALASENATAKIVQETRTEGSVAASLGINNVLQPKLDASASGSVSRSTTSTIERIQSVATIAVRHLLTENRHPTWDIRETEGRPLAGTPWDPINEPQFKFKFVGDKVSTDPHMRVVVKCRSEDLILKSIKIKDEGKQSLWKRNRNPEINRVAAEQFLKELIKREGLPLPNIAQAYGDVVVADVILTVE